MKGILYHILTLTLLVVLTSGAPQGPPPEEKPSPYEYNYKVEDAENSVYYGAKEEGTDAGKVEGSYYVWLPDGRLMTVTYTVDGESGFVSKINFEDNAKPIGAAGK